MAKSLLKRQYFLSNVQLTILYFIPSISLTLVFCICYRQIDRNIPQEYWQQMIEKNSDADVSARVIFGCDWMVGIFDTSIEFFTTLIGVEFRPRKK